MCALCSVAREGGSYWYSQLLKEFQQKLCILICNYIILYEEKLDRYWKHKEKENSDLEVEGEGSIKSKKGA